MKIKKSIESKLQEVFNPVHLQVIDESDQHNVPVGKETHFKVVLVSNDFEGKVLVARHRWVNQVLREELAGEVHALSLHTVTPDEWEKRNEVPPKSPPCLGGSE